MKSIITGMAMVAFLTTLAGCGSDQKKSDASGPRITSGNVDTSVKPEKPSLGGKMESGK